ncbi:MAG: hypothetical protein E7402_06085, partial [Ruminococcaceae bacterium]|nr:hypothetical protein [Oscillospiraceae bacterium]
MGYRVNFLDNQTVTALDMNAITEELGSGALSFMDDTLYGVKDLNQISHTLVGKGVSRGMSLSLQDGQVRIAEGSAFMADGKRVEVDQDGVLLDYVSGAVNYVWLYRDVITDFVVPRCTTEEPFGEDFVVLGSISKDGMIDGRPDLAVMKNSFLGLNKMEVYTLEITNGAGAREAEEELFQEIPLTYEGHRCIFVTGTSSHERKNNVCGVVELETGETYGLFGHDKGNAPQYAERQINNEGILTVCWCSSGYYDYQNSLRFELGTDNVLRLY